MATIDNYISLLIDQKAQSLRFRTDSDVQLLGGEEASQIGSDVLDTEQIISMLEEVLPPDFSEHVEGTSKVFHYASPFGEVRITVNIKNNIASVNIERLGGEEETADQDRECGAKIEELFHTMLDLDASDLHLKSGQMPMVRVYGAMQFLDGSSVLDNGEVEGLIKEVMPEESLLEFEKNKDTDFAYKLGERARFRCNVFEDIGGIGGVFRHIPNRIRTAEELDIPPAMLELCDNPKGLILVTGPTNSGKTTSLAAMLNYLNETRSAHIITIEDPVEYLHEDNKCLVNQRQVGSNTKNFKSALRAALREDPDIILVGELRDLETMEIVMETAETGHLVFATLHTNTAPTTVDRIIDQFPAVRQNQIRTMLSDTLVGVVSQTLCNRREGGLVAAFEVLIVTHAVSHLIREGKTFQIPSAMQMSKDIGMQDMNSSLISLAKQKVIDPEEAYMRSILKKDMSLELSLAGFRGKWSEEFYKP